jgi:sec-independent protein translocase protein TatA
MSPAQKGLGNPSREPIIMGLDNPIHIAFLLILLLLVFGAKRLPEMGRSLGSGMRGFKDALSGEDAQPPTPAQQPQAVSLVQAVPVAQVEPATAAMQAVPIAAPNSAATPVAAHIEEPRAPLVA